MSNLGINSFKKIFISGFANLFMKKWVIFGIVIGIIVVVIIGIFFVYVGKECKTGADCLAKTCFTSQCTDNKCVYSPISDCCGNDKCEVGETYPECVVDCPNCDDKNNCTVDEYDYHEQKCVNIIIPNVICCGNKICETSETYETCAQDCPNCDDDNNCTKDTYDYYEQECINELIVPCCGNDVCEEGAETYSGCLTDCPNCDDDNKLTTDSFNYKTQKCENPVTHYFIDDFENGTQNWDFYDACEGKPTTTAWTTIVEDGNTVLKGTGHNWADLKGREWNNYIFKFRFKRIKGDPHAVFRHDYFAEGALNRYFVSLIQGRLIRLEKQFGPSAEHIETLKEVAFRFDGDWHTFEIRGYDNILNIYIDDKLIIKYKDTENPVLSGRVAFETLRESKCCEGCEESEFLVDDVEIKVISEKDIIYP